MGFDRSAILAYTYKIINEESHRLYSISGLK
jgi:hypothetical protein